MTTITEAAPAGSWAEANHRFLLVELERLRLVLQRRVLWLRRQWTDDSLHPYQGLVISDSQVDRLLAEGREAEATFYRTDLAALEIARRIAALEKQRPARIDALSRIGAPPALKSVSELFDLTPFEQEVLLLSLAPELDARFKLLYAYLQDDATLRHPTPHLALTLFAMDDWVGCWSSFLPQAPLRRFQLVVLEPASGSIGSLAAMPLKVDERVAGFLLGAASRGRECRTSLDARVKNLLLPLPEAPLPSGHREVVQKLHRWLAPETRRGAWPVLNLVGPPGAGKASVARALCARVGLQPAQLRVERLPPPGVERNALLRILEREAILLQLALYIDAPTPRVDPAHSPVGDDVLEQLGVFMILASHDRWSGHRSHLGVRLSKPDAAAQAELWQEALGAEAAPLDGHLHALAEQFDMGPTKIVRAIKIAAGRTQLLGGATAASVTLDELWQACREELGTSLDGLAQRIVPRHTWEDIVLPHDLLLHLREIAGQVAQRARVYEEWGFGGKLSRGRGISALFAGPSGTGKTMAAEIIAHDLRLDLVRVDLAGVVSKYIGETEKNLRQVFDAAEQSGAILFFDEADALFGKRSEVKDSHDRYANIEINYLLQRMEDYRGLAILATNMKSHLDAAFVRRLRFLVDFTFPDARERARIWKVVFPHAAALDALDYEVLASMEIPGGSIRNIAVNAAFLAANAGEPIGMTHVMRAAQREYTKINKLPLQSELRARSRAARR